MPNNQPPVDVIQGEAKRALTAPWADFHGDLPDYDHPMRCVFESGVQYTVELLAKELKATDWTPCDGTEEYDGDLGGTLMNIVLAAMPKDEHGDPVHPTELLAFQSETRAGEARTYWEGVEDAARVAENHIIENITEISDYDYNMACSEIANDVRKLK